MKALCPVVEEVSAITFPEVPETVNEETNVLVFAGNTSVCATDPSSLRSLNVFSPEMVIEFGLVPLENQTLLYVNPPPAKVALFDVVFVNFIVDASGYKVIPVVVHEILQDPEFPVQYHVPFPI